MKVLLLFTISVLAISCNKRTDSEDSKKAISRIKSDSSYVDDTSIATIIDNRPIEQKKTIHKVNPNCGCATDSIMTAGTMNCDTTILKNKSKLYYQFNCDSIWLSLANTKGQKFILYSEVENFEFLSELQWRLAYRLVKEYDKYILFRSGCPANGPCSFTLINKFNGKVKREFDELIYEHDPRVFYDFLIYLSEKYDKIMLYSVRRNKEIAIPVNKTHFKAVIPEYQFNKIVYDNEILYLTYEYDFGDKPVKEKTIKIDIRKYFN